MTARQLVGRGRRLVPAPVLAVGTSARHPVLVNPVAAGVGVEIAPQSGPVPRPEEDGVFRAYGVARRFGEERFWTDDANGLLFLFHLHGFSALAAYAAGHRTPAGDAFWKDVIISWLDRFSKPAGPAWHPFPTSVRLISWSAALSAIGWPEPFSQRVARAMTGQARYLARSIEHDIGGNHVLKNATALVIAGSVVPSSGVAEKGLRVLSSELPRQFLADGGHEERSTSYHLAVTHDLDDVARVFERSQRRVPGWLRDTLDRAHAWLDEMTGPDERLPMLNDAWEGPPRSGKAAAPFSALAESGYLVFRHRGDQAILDVGPVSPSHLPPHAHADVLAFVLWIEGRPVLIDPGSFTYTGDWRNRFRSTAAHNTVEIDGTDQCEFWGDFRAAFPPAVSVGSVAHHGDIVCVTASHDGYRRLDDPVVHHRAFIWWPGAGIVVLDVLAAREPHEIRSSLHLAPGLAIEADGTVASLHIASLNAPGERTAEGDAYSPYLGTKIESITLRYQGRAVPGRPFGWSALRGGGSVASLDSHRIVLAREGQPVVEVPLNWNRGLAGDR